MKRIKQLIAVFAAVFILASMTSLPTLAASGDELRYGRTALSKMNNAAGLLYVYDKLVEGCGKAETEIQVKKSGKTIRLGRDDGRFQRPSQRLSRIFLA